MNEPIPALSYRSRHYPERYGSRVPRRVRITASPGVTPDLPLAFLPENKGMVCRFGEEFDVSTNSHGAVAAIFPDGRQLGLRPDEFEVIDWYDTAMAVTS